MARLDPEQARTLQLRLHGQILLPSDGNAFRQAAGAWNLNTQRAPLAIVKCAGAADVAETVQLVRRLGLALTVAGGRMSTACQRNDAVCLDLTLMRAVVVDRAAQTARVQAGARTIDALMECGRCGLQFPLAYYRNTGVGGFTLAGGVGVISGRCGLAVDNLLSMEVVTADGQVLRCSATEYPDLFWAMRGAGANFAVATLFEFKLTPVDMIFGGLYLFNNSADVTRYLLTYQKAVFPSEKMLFATFFGGAISRAEASEGPTTAGVICSYFGNTEAEDEVDPSAYNYWRDLYLLDMDEHVIAAVMQILENRPFKSTVIVLQPLGPAVARVPVESTAFAHRKARYLVHLSCYLSKEFLTPEIEAAGRSWVDNGASLLEPHSCGVPAGYVCDVDVDLSRVYGEHLPRLRQLKTKWDPTNFFRFNHNIPPILDPDPAAAPVDCGDGLGVESGGGGMGSGVAVPKGGWL